MKALATIALAALLVAAASGASAQQVDLRIEDGLVTLDARNAAVRAILAEWERVGGALVVNGELVGGGLVTLQLDAVPEAEALDIVLRDASGYIAAPRRAGAPDGASAFDRIVVLASSTAPRAVPRPGPAARAGAARGAGTPVPQRVAPTAVPQPPAPAAEPEEAPAERPPTAPPPRQISPFLPGIQIPVGASDRPGVISPPPEPD